MKYWILAALLAVAGSAQAGGLVALGKAVIVQPAGSGAAVVRVQAAMAAADHGDELQLTARTPSGNRLLVLPATAAGELQAALAKAQQWVQVARDNQVDISKPLACIGADPSGACSETGVAIDGQQLGLLFTAADNGAASALLVTFRSGPGGAERAAFYLTDSGLAQLADHLSGWQQGLAEARRQQDRSGLFN